MFLHSFKKIVFAWLFAVLAAFNAVSIFPSSTPEAPFSASGALLYKSAFPGKLLHLDKDDQAVLTSLGRAVLFYSHEQSGGTLIEQGVIQNIGLLDIIADQMTQNMQLDLGRAAYAYESVALKPVQKISQKQASIRALSSRDVKAFREALAPLTPYEASFLSGIRRSQYFRDANIPVVAEIIKPLLSTFIPGLLQRGQANKYKSISSMFKARVVANLLSSGLSSGLGEAMARAGLTSDQMARVQEASEDLLSKAEKDVLESMGRSSLRGEPDAEMMETLKSLIPTILPIAADLILGRAGSPTPLAEKINKAGNDFQNNLKSVPAAYTLFSHIPELVACTNITGAYLQVSSLSNLILPMIPDSSYVSSASIQRYGPTILGGTAALYEAYTQMKSLKAHYARLKAGRDVLVPVAQFVRGAKTVYEIVSNNRAFQQALPVPIVKGFEQFFGEDASSDFKEIERLAATATFDDTDSTFFMIGNYARFAQLVTQYHENFKNLGRVLGYIDYVTMLAQFVGAQREVTNAQGQTIAFSYAHFVESDRPYVHAQDLWFPAYDRTKVVATNVSLGDGDKAHHLLITGVNGCGKSIVMSAMTALVVMAHTHGIVAARENALSPFDYVIFHGNIADEKGAGLSKGVKEMVCCADIIKKVRDAGNDDIATLTANVSSVADVIEKTRSIKGNIYLTFDELFSATDPVSAERLSRVVIKSLIKNPHLMMVATTHNRSLTRLEEETKGLVRNAFVETDFDENTGRVDYKRQLVSGVNHSMPALFIMKDKLKEHGIQDAAVMELIDTAIEEQRREGGFVAA